MDASPAGRIPRTVWVLGFVTSRTPDTEIAGQFEGVVGVFVPSSPNPAMGQLVYVTPERIRELDMPVEKAAKLVISFGIRNVTDIDAALREARRVLKPGGRFLCLEFSRPPVEALARAYDAYSFKVIPQVGEWVAKDRASYQYLVESIRRFPDQKTFAAMMEKAGFSRVTITNFTGGVAAMHQGWAI